MGIPSTGSASGKSSEMRVTDSGGAVNFAHKVRFPGSEDVSGFSDVQRQAPSDVRKTLLTMGSEIKPMSVEQFAAFVKNEKDKYREIVKISGAKVN